MIAAGSFSDPFDFLRAGAYPAFSDPGTRTLVHPRLIDGERTAVFVCAGQSLMASSENAIYAIINPTKVQNLNVYDGGVYQAVQPLLGCGVWNAGGNWLCRLADKLIAAGKYDRVILVPVAVGSTPIREWQAGGLYNPKLIAAFRRCAALGYTVTAIIWGQGEQDRVDGTSAAAYLASLQNLIASPRVEGYLAPWFISLETWDGSTTSAGLRQAQQAVVNGIDVLQGADVDTISSGTYRYDGVHLNATGANALADLWMTSLTPLWD